MISLSKIDENLNVYKKNKVIMIGVGKEATKILKMFEYFGIKVSAFYNYSNQKISRYINPDLIINEQELRKIVSEKDTLIQMALPKQYNDEINELIKKMNITTFINYEEAENILIFLKVSQKMVNTHDFFNKGLKVWRTRKDSTLQGLNHFLSIYDFKQTILVCMPPKTGDHTLKYTFEENDIDCYFCYHFLDNFANEINLDENNKIKFIVGLREPIGQNISILYQILEGISHLSSFLLVQTLKISLKEKRDIQQIFKELLLLYNYPGNMENTKYSDEIQHIIPFLIQQWIPQFCENIIDIMKYPFDKDKGYSIIKEKNIEIFVYQLEKLNNLIPELSQWTGVHFDKLENGNITADKWTADSYKQAQNELVITQEYFDACFNEPYVKHCYSDEDIEKFKAKWKNHIR